MWNSVFNNIENSTNKIRDLDDEFYPLQIAKLLFNLRLTQNADYWNDSMFVEFVISVQLQNDGNMYKMLFIYLLELSNVISGYFTAIPQNLLKSIDKTFNTIWCPGILAPTQTHVIQRILSMLTTFNIN